MSAPLTDGRTVVVVAGAARSGTSLTRRLLGSHPRIWVPDRELKVLDVVEGRVDVDGYLDRLPLDDWGVDVADLRGRPVGEVHRALVHRLADVAGAEVAGEKSPGNELCWEQLQDWFAADRLLVVHLVRDPVDRLGSLVHAPFRARVDIDVDAAAEAHRWVESVELARARAADHPDRYRLLRYEDLTADPDRESADLFGWIGVPHDPVALTLHAYGDRDNTSFPDDAGRVGTLTGAGAPAQDGTGGRIRTPGSRRDVLDAEEVATVARITGDLAARLGYRTR